MKEQHLRMKETIRHLLLPPVSETVRRTIVRNNLESLRQISIGTAVVESIILLLFSLHHLQDLTKYPKSVISVGFCIIASIYVAVHLTRVQRSKEVIEGPLRRESCILILYFIVMAFWGMAASYRHYMEGEQMLTFFIVEIVFICFVAIKPLLGAVLIFGSHIIFYLVIYTVDGGSGISPLNYFAMAVLMWIGIVVRYQSVLENVTQRFEVERLNRKLERISQTDVLTDIGNRMAIREDFDRIVGNDVAAMMADIDHFKQVNDNYGHRMGDLAIQRLSQCLEKGLEVDYRDRADFVEKFDPAKDNVLARLGGDEFVFACHCPSEASCLEKMRGLQAAFAKEEITLDGQQLSQLRFSCGVIHYQNNLSNVDQLYQKADQLMYKVKKQGGGNVLLARS